MIKQVSEHIKHWPGLTIIMVISSAFLLYQGFPQRAAAQPEPWELNFHYNAGELITIKSINNNLSGLTYHPGSDHLYAVLNNPEKIIEMTKQGEVIRSIDLQGFNDTESIDYLGNGLFVVSEERRRRLVFFYLDADTRIVNYTDTQQLPLDWASDENTGFEGVAWSAVYGFFILQEQPPKLIHHMLHDAEPIMDVDKLNASRSLDVDDYAGISLLQADQELLLILSEASHSLHLMNLKGEELSRLSLRKGWLNLWPLMTQPEGVAVDKDGNIYVVGEPNQLLVLNRTAPFPGTR
jgi:uncharacterized protein YjiK